MERTRIEPSSLNGNNIESQPVNQRALFFVRLAIQHQVVSEIAERIKSKKQRSNFTLNVRMLEEYLSTDQTYWEVAERYDLNSRKKRTATYRIQTRLKRTISKLWQNAPYQLKNQFDSTILIFNRKPTSERTKDRLSWRRGGARIAVIPLAKKGLSRKEIAKRTRISPGNISSIMYSERRLGKLPTSRMGDSSYAMERLNREGDLLDFSTKKALMEMVSTKGLRNKEMFVSFRDFCREIGINGYVKSDQVEEFLRALEELGCASRIITHGNRKIFFLRSDLESLIKRRERSAKIA